MRLVIPGVDVQSPHVQTITTFIVVGATRVELRLLRMETLGDVFTRFDYRVYKTLAVQKSFVQSLAVSRREG